MLNIVLCILIPAVAGAAIVGVLVFALCRMAHDSDYWEDDGK